MPRVVWRFLAAAACVKGVTAHDDDPALWSKNAKAMIEKVGSQNAQFHIPFQARRGGAVVHFEASSRPEGNQNQNDFKTDNVWCSDVHRVCTFSLVTDRAVGDTAEDSTLDFGSFNEEWGEARATIRDEVKKSLDLFSGEDWCVDVPGGFIKGGPSCRLGPEIPGYPAGNDLNCKDKAGWETIVQVRDPTQCNGLTRGQIAAIAVGAAVVFIVMLVVVLYMCTDFFAKGGCWDAFRPKASGCCGCPCANEDQVSAAEEDKREPVSE